MRSGGRSAEGQSALPFDVPEAAPPGAGRRAPARRRPAGAEDDHHRRVRLRTDVLASRGWPPGTELLVDRSRRPQRGEVALVSEGGRTRIGVLDVQLGRRVLRSDHGTAWVGTTARFVGVVTMAEAPLAGMPDLPAPEG